MSKIMKQAILFIALAALFGLLPAQADAATQNSRDAIIEQLKRATQELLDAVAPGDVAVWKKYLAEGCLYTDEEGNVMLSNVVAGIRAFSCCALSPLPVPLSPLVDYYRARRTSLTTDASSAGFSVDIRVPLRSAR